jgi:hypothetical protein
LHGDHARSKCGGTFAFVIECCLRAIVAMLTKASGASYMRDELLLDIQKTIK